MNAALIILNYNSWEMTKKLASKVSQFECVNKVYVIDNKSTDNSFEELKKIESFKITVHQTDKNGGYSYGNNEGAKLCYENDEEIVFISNPDVDVEEDDVKKIISAFEKSDYSMLSGVEYNADDQIVYPLIWRFHTYADDLLDCFFIGRQLEKKRKQIKLNYDAEIQPVEMIKGSFFSLRLKDFFEVGGFDENVFLFCEERIISKKFIINQKRIGIVTAAKYKHMHSATINKEYKAVAFQIRMLYKARMYYNKQYLKIGKIRELILKIAMQISILEYTLKDIIEKKRT